MLCDCTALQCNIICIK